MRFIHIADVHLGAVPDEGKPWSDRRKQDIWDTFAEVIEVAETEKIDFLFIAGDLFQRQPLLRELKEVNYLFRRISRTKVVLIAGNHDYLHPKSYYNSFQWEENVYFIGSKEISNISFEKENVCIYGSSYWQREIRDPIYGQIEELDTSKINILLFHGGGRQTHTLFLEKAGGGRFRLCGQRAYPSAGELWGEQDCHGGSAAAYRPE